MDAKLWIYGAVIGSIALQNLNGKKHVNFNSPYKFALTLKSMRNLFLNLLVYYLEKQIFLFGKWLLVTKSN